MTITAKIAPSATLIEFLGRSAEDWSKIDYLMKASGVTLPHLENILRGRRPEAPPEITVEVYDAVNPKRLLGTMVDLAAPPSGPRICFEVASRVSAYFDPFAHVAPMMTNRIEFSRAFRDGSGWDRKGVLETSAPLKTLLTLPKFRLPDETRRQAEERRYRQ